MIEEHYDSLEKVIVSNSLVILINFHRTYTSPETGYIKGEVVFIDSSSLIIFQHVRVEENKLIITDYRYQYMDIDNRLVFRYDNAPHHPEINTFPHHQHFPSEIKEASMPNIEDVLAEIDSSIIRKIKLN